MSHHHLCPVAQVAKHHAALVPCVCIQLHTAEQDALDAAGERVRGGLTFCHRHDDDDNCVEAIEVGDAVAAIKGEQ